MSLVGSEQLAVDSGERHQRGVARDGTRAGVAKGNEHGVDGVALVQRQVFAEPVQMLSVVGRHGLDGVRPVTVVFEDDET